MPAPLLRRSRVSGDDGAPYERDATLGGPVSRPIAADAAWYPRRLAMECFGRAVLELLECSRCFAAIVPASDAAIAEQVRIGCPASQPIPASLVARLASRLRSNDAVTVSSTHAGDALLRGIVGEEDANAPHAITARISVDGAEVVFVAAWRALALTTADVAWLSRTIPVIWTTTTRLMHPRLERFELPLWLEEIVLPTFVVDEDLRLRDLNRSGRQLLGKGEPLRADFGLLAGLHASATSGLKEAVRKALRSRSDHRWTSATVVLSTGHRKFAFAWVGALPTRHDTGQALVIVPRVDEAAGAGRIASAFGLSAVEEKIVARILQGESLRLIGAHLSLTEATVRTYTKRIMLKLGINRQSELFLLYILTLSPFGGGRPERPVSGAMPSRGLHGRTNFPQENSSG